MKLSNITIIKLGGSIITDKSKPYTPRLKNIQRFTREIKKINTPLIIVHGSGSFGHTSAKIYGGKKGYISTFGISKVSYDAMWINNIVMDIMIKNEIPAISLRPASILQTAEGEIINHNFNIIPELLRQGLIPVVYGDVIWDTKWKSTIYSGDKLITHIGLYLQKQKISVNKIIYTCDTDGVSDKNGERIPVINVQNWKELLSGSFTKISNDVTGGMRHKVEQSLKLAKNGVPTCIINGYRKGELINAFLGKPVQGTLIK